MLDHDSVIGVIGAGAMGTGIAQVAASAGNPVILSDAVPGAAERAIGKIESSLQRQVEKKKLTDERAREIVNRLSVANSATGDFSSFSDCGLVIEAIVEDLEVKRRAFTELERMVTKQCVLATNTSSLSITAIARACAHPERVIGIHFFNPATVLPLVEVVPGLLTSGDVVHAVRALVDSWGKTTVIASDTPGFIVNRVARPFYGEALRILEEGIADRATIDWAMHDLGGFRMGPFELMDFIGNDVNLATTTAVFGRTFFDPRYRPSITQQRLVDAGLLGRKAGRGFYSYSADAIAPEPNRDEQLGRQIVERIVAMLINEAVDAVAHGIASERDVDLAVTRGVNYPRGLLAWANDIGLANVLDTLEKLRNEYNEDRYRPSVLLKRMVREGRKFHENVA